MKKKNNPFKMWGSWIGAVIGGLPLILPQIAPHQLANIIAQLSILITTLNPLTYILALFFEDWGPVILGIWTAPIVYFLIGWLITVLWRKYK